MKAKWRQLCRTNLPRNGSCSEHLAALSVHRDLGRGLASISVTEGVPTYAEPDPRPSFECSSPTDRIRPRRCTADARAGAVATLRKTTDGTETSHAARLVGGKVCSSPVGSDGRLQRRHQHRRCPRSEDYSRGQGH